MRSKRKEITRIEELREILDQALVLRLAMCRDNRPYVVPLCFALDEDRIVIHSAKQGLKVEMIRENPWVCFEAETDVELAPSQESACGFGMRYRSVIGFGRAQVAEDPDEVRAGLDLLMRKYAAAAHYEQAGGWEYRPKSLALTAIITVRIESMTGKRDAREIPDSED